MKTGVQTSWSGVSFGVALGVLAAFQLFKVPPVLPVLFSTYGHGKVMAGSLMSVYAVVGLLLSLRIGRALAGKGVGPFLAGAALMFVSGNLIAIAGAESAALLLLSRTLEGLAFAVLAIAGGVIVIANAAPAHQPLAVALWATWIPAGQVLASLSTLCLLSAAGWQALWYEAVFLTLLLCVWGSRLVAGGRITLLVPAGVDRSVGHPVVTGFNRWALSLTAVLFALWSCQFNAYMTWLPQFLVEVHGFDPSQAMWGYLLPPLMLMVSNVVAGLLLQGGVGLGVLMSISFTVQTVVWFLVPEVGAGYDGLVSLIAYGLAAGVAPTCFFALPGALTGDRTTSSQAFGILMSGRNLGVLIGPVLLAQVIQINGEWGGVTSLFGLICLGALLLAVLVVRLIPSRADLVCRENAATCSLADK